MKSVPTNATTSLRTREEIIKRIFVDYITATLILNILNDIEGE